MKHLIIFDFDGVIAESEAISNTELASMVSDLGFPTTREDAYRRYMGKRLSEVIESIVVEIGRPVPSDFTERLQNRIMHALRTSLEPVSGAREFLDQFAYVPQCIASSSSVERLSVSLEALALSARFAEKVFSAEMVSRGKPSPDIFLHAASAMGFQPGNCIVVEDGASGVLAARAAGMTVVGLLAASHIQDGHRDVLQAAGAHFIANTFSEVKAFVEPLLV